MSSFLLEATCQQKKKGMTWFDVEIVSQFFFFFFLGADTMLPLELQFQGSNSTNQILEVIQNVTSRT